MRQATAADRAEIEAFLDRDPPRTMFPRANLADHGMGGTHRRSMRFWLDGPPGALRGLLGMTTEGTLLPVMPDDPARAAPVLAGLEPVGAIGPPEQVGPLLAAAGLARAPVTLDDVQPHLMLDLADLAVPEGPGEIVPLAAIDTGTALAWLAAYNGEALKLPTAAARARAEADLATFRATGSHVALVADGVPLAVTGLNAALPHIVQIGGVYTPPAARGRGLARRAVALHLAALRARGVRQATLFASGPPALRAYEAIGFRRIGRWQLTMFDGAQPARPPVEARA